MYNAESASEPLGNNNNSLAPPLLLLLIFHLHPYNNKAVLYLSEVIFASFCCRLS